MEQVINYQEEVTFLREEIEELQNEIGRLIIENKSQKKFISQLKELVMEP